MLYGKALPGSPAIGWLVSAGLVNQTGSLAVTSSRRLSEGGIGRPRSQDGSWPPGPGPELGDRCGCGPPGGTAVLPAGWPSEEATATGTATSAAVAAMAVPAIRIR